MIEPGEAETESGSASAGDGPATGGPATANPSAGVETGDPNDTDSTGGVDESSGSDSTGALPAGLCGRTAVQNVAVLARGPELSLLRGDGTEIELVLELVGLPEDTYFEVRAALDAELVAVTVEWTFVDGGLRHGGVLATFDADGTPRWTHVEDDAVVTGAVIGAGGSVAVTRNQGTGTTDGLFFDDEGTMDVLADFRPAAGLRPDGLLPGFRTAGPGWADPLDGSFQGVAGDVSGVAYFAAAGDVVYMDDAVVVREAPDGAAAFVIDGDGEDTLIMSFADPWALVATGLERRFVRVDTGGGDPEEVELVAPKENEPFGCQFVDPVIDRDGGVIYPVRDAFAAGIQRVEPPAAVEGIGQRHTNIEGMSTHVHGGTYVVVANAAGTTFCGLPQWEPNNKGFPEGGIEIVRPADAFSLLLEGPGTEWAYANAEGDCAVYSGFDSDTVVVDPESGMELAVGGATQVVF